MKEAGGPRTLACFLVHTIKIGHAHFRYDVIVHVYVYVYVYVYVRLRIRTRHRVNTLRIRIRIRTGRRVNRLYAYTLQRYYLYAASFNV